MLVLPGVMVRGVRMRRPRMALLNGRPTDLVLEPQNTEKEPLDSVEGFASLSPFRFGLMTVSDANLVGLIRPTRPTAHGSKATQNGPTSGEGKPVI